MFANPFSPIFGGKPGVFFGRDEILRRFNLAMEDPGSDDRALFFTGTRGSGKTALLEQLSIRAGERGLRVIDLGPEDTIAQLTFALTGFDESTTTLAPQASASTLGSGGSLSVGAVAKTRRPGRESLQALFLEACEKAEHGLLVTVDEVQKVPVDDVSSLCNAFQMASRKGHDVLLAVAGLPYSHDEIVGHEGCTYLRRAAHEELGLFSWEVAARALRDVFDRIKGLTVGDDLLDTINKASYGHPYLMQLLGYHLIRVINNGDPGKRHEANGGEVEQAMELSMLAYERRALKPLVDELPATERRYLRAMAQRLDDDRLVSTESVAKSLGTTQKSLGKARARLMGNGIIAAPERGKVMFCVPYLADYLCRDEAQTDTVTQARLRRV